MLDNSVAQFFLLGWPVMVAAPGVAIILIALGGAAGWWLKTAIAKGRIDGLVERVAGLSEAAKLADRHKAFVEAQRSEAVAKHNEVSNQLKAAQDSISVLELQIRSGASQVALTNTTASVSAHIADATGASRFVGQSLSRIELDHALRYRNFVAAIYPPASSPPSPTLPESPAEK